MAHEPELELLASAANLLHFKLTIGGFYVGCNCRECDALRPLHEANEKIKEARYLLLGPIAQAPSAAQKSPEAVGEGKGPSALPHHS